MRRVLPAVLVLWPLLGSAAETKPASVVLRDSETIVFYGDSITEQNLYTAYLETFLLSRFPEKKLAVFNLGWSGDTASGGNARFARDVAGVAPTLVFVNFGMNDGGYRAYDETIYRSYLDAQRALADTIRRSGAREALFTTSPIDDVLRGDKGVYNDMLSRMARGVIDLAGERQLPVIDLLHPMVEVQKQAKAKDPAFTMIPDTVHPNPVGHLVMAYLAMRQVEAPRAVAEIAIDGSSVAATGAATVANVAAGDDGVTFDLALPFLPFYVPKEARKALDLVPLQEELNRFQLRAKTADRSLVLSIDGKTAGTFSAEQLASGVDLALLDNAPWSVAGRLLWEASQYRWRKHFEAWRQMGLDRPAWMMPQLASFAPLAQAQRAYADELGRSLRLLAQPRTYRLSLRPAGERVAIRSLELSPTYPLEGFDTPEPPEKDPAAVTWTRAAFVDGQIDLGSHFSGAMNVVGYARLVLEADRASILHLSMGSDDGLAVFLGGKRAFAHDALRSMRPGEDEVELPLAAGRNELLFKVTQAGGQWGLAVEAQVRGRGGVRQIE